MIEPAPYSGRVKIFSDGADVASMVRLAANPLIQGFTTNPTLMRQAGVSDYRAFASELLAQIRDKPISFEVFADELDEMESQAREIAGWGPNVYVKIPVTNCAARSAAEVIHRLASSGVRVNVTAILTLEQVSTVCAALAGGAPSVVSVFAGRIADTGREPVPLMREALDICRRHGAQIELLWASPREVLNIAQADALGCDIITVTPDLLKKMSLFGKDLGEFSLETVQMFRRDAEAAGFEL